MTNLDWNIPLETDAENPEPCEVVHALVNGERVVIVGIGTSEERAAMCGEDGVEKWGQCDRLCNVKPKLPSLSGFLPIYGDRNDAAILSGGIFYSPNPLPQTRKGELGSLEYALTAVINLAEAVKHPCVVEWPE